MELSDSELKLRFFFLIWLFKWQLGAWIFQILTLLAGLLPNTETEMAAFIIGYVCMLFVVSLVEVC